MPLLPCSLCSLLWRKPWLVPCHADPPPFPAQLTSIDGQGCLGPSTCVACTQCAGKHRHVGRQKIVRSGLYLVAKSSCSVQMSLLCPELSLTPVPLLQSQGPYEYIAQEEPGRSRLVPRLWCGQPNLGVSQRHNSDQYDYSLKCSHTSKSKCLHPLTFPAGQSSFASCPIF